jgi:enterochelin esterase-like enzyme
LNHRAARLGITAALALGLLLVAGDRIGSFGAPGLGAAPDGAVQNPRDRISDAFWMSFPESLRSFASPRPAAAPASATIGLNPRDYMAPDFWLNLPDSVPNVTYVDNTFFSPALGQNASYLVVLPPGYDQEPGRFYPVLYMLHGIGGFRSEWLGYGFVEHARKLMAEGVIEPMIIVFPEGGPFFWVNKFPDGPRYGDFVAVDVVNQIDSRYRTIPTREGRAIGGLSNGATGALQIGLRHQSVFGTIGSHSPAVRTLDEAPEFFGDQAWFEEFVYPGTIARTTGGSGQRILVDIGVADEWIERALNLSQDLTAAGIDHELQIPDGGHDGFYWHERSPDYLRFYNQSFIEQRALLASR